jgi:hypothetical protein
MGSSPDFSPHARTRRRPPSRILSLASLVLALLVVALSVGGVAIASGVHSKAPSVEPIDAVFHIAASGTIEASLEPPIEGVLRIIVRSASRAGTSSGRPQPDGSIGPRQPQSEFQPITLEVTQSDRPIPFRLVDQSGRHNLFGGRPSLLVADIDVNDLTPGMPVHVSIHSSLSTASNSAPLDLEARAYQVVY